MKALFSLKKHSYLKAIGTFIIALALIAGVVGCEGEGEPDTYELTIAVSPPDSGTATDVTGASPYEEGAVVDIQADPAMGYEFAMWSAPAGTFTTANAAATTFTMPAQAITVVANFVGPLDHFKGYEITGSSPLGENVVLSDQFFPDGFDTTVQNARFFFNPTDKLLPQEQTLISNEDHHLTMYELSETEYGRFFNVEVTNQFNDGEPQYLTVGGPIYLAVPTQKAEPGDHEPPLGLDHYLVYTVVNNVTVNVPLVELGDQFGVDPPVAVGKAALFANPVKKTHVGVTIDIRNNADHLVFYEIDETEVYYPNVIVNNQFGDEQNLLLGNPAVLLGVPSEKTSWGERLDHFTEYLITEVPQYAGKNVTLDDQFVDNLQTTVGSPVNFFNPAAKTLTDTLPWIAHPDYHLTYYDIDYLTPPWWDVVIENQFGKQEITIMGPVGLLVPTQKVDPGGHAAPEYLDHYAVYPVIVGTYTGEIPVLVKDQFCPHMGEEVLVTGVQRSFCVPVQITVDGEVTPIRNPLQHLTCYDITGADYSYPQVQVADQFLAQTLTLGAPATGLLVPSLKLDWAPYSH